MKSAKVINDALSSWRPVQHAPDLAHETFDQLDADEIQRLALRGYTEEVRAALRRKVDGVPVYTSIVRSGPDGAEQRIYKQTELFDVDDYSVAIRFYMRESRANHRVAAALQAQCAQRLGVQLALVADLEVAS